MKFVVGLGNPGERYVHTRHNIGWWVLDELAAALGIAQERERWEGLLVGTDRLTLFKPLTHMNESGRAVAALANETGAALPDLLVVLDDLNLSLGTLRLRPRGSAGGHRGLQSVIDCLGTEEFSRLRLGIGPGAPVENGRDFVLSPFEQEELLITDRLVERAVLAVRCWVEEGVEAAMSRYNGQVNGADESAGRQ